MQRALVDTSVLYAAAYSNDERHDGGLAILRGIDAGELPRAVVLDLVLAETLNGITEHAGHEAAVNFLDRLERNERFRIDRLDSSALVATKRTFRRYEELSFVDAALVAFAAASDVEYLYAFDDDFDAAAVRRLATATNPYAPD